VLYPLSYAPLLCFHLVLLFVGKHFSERIHNGLRFVHGLRTIELAGPLRFTATT